MSTEKSVLHLVQQAIETVVPVEPGKAKPEATLESLGVDSLDVVEIIMAVEDRLNISIDEDAAPGVEKTVADLAAFIDALASADQT